MPTSPRTVTGNVALLTGEARAGIRVTFTRTGAGDVFAQYGDVVVNEPVSVTSGAGGALAVTLYPGAYDVVAEGSNGPKRFTAALAEDGSDDLADLIGQASPPITSTEVLQARDARDEAQAALAALQSGLLIYVSDDADTITVVVGASTLVSETDDPYPAATVELVTQ
jgi:hypothetical protein